MARSQAPGDHNRNSGTSLLGTSRFSILYFLLSQHRVESRCTQAPYAAPAYRSLSRCTACRETRSDPHHIPCTFERDSRATMLSPIELVEHPLVQSLFTKRIGELLKLARHLVRELFLREPLRNGLAKFFVGVDRGRLVHECLERIGPLGPARLNVEVN